eukprot:2769046-Rhodomonas_salina.2
MGAGASRKRQTVYDETSVSKKDGKDTEPQRTFRTDIVPGSAVQDDVLMRGRDKFGEHETALANHAMVLQLKTAKHGRDHLDVAKTLGDIGQMYIEMGKPAEALLKFEEALRILEKLLGCEHDEVARILN